MQALYNLLDRELEWELVPVCLNEGLDIILWSLLRGGWLSGKYHRGLNQALTGTLAEFAHQHGISETWAKYANEHTWTVAHVLLKVAKQSGRTPAQVALNWLLTRPGVTAPIIDARNMSQLVDNIGAVGWRLDAAQIGALDEASAKRLPYTYDHMHRV